MDQAGVGRNRSADGIENDFRLRLRARAETHLEHHFVVEKFELSNFEPLALAVWRNKSVPREIGELPPANDLVLGC
jgi:hypothetical protein